MVMGRRPDVETAGPLDTGRALVGLGISIGSALATTPLRRPWRGPSNPASNWVHELVRGPMKAMMSYSAALPTPQLRSIEIVIDDLSGIAMPPPWRRFEIEITEGSVGGVPGQWITPRHREHTGVLIYFHGGGYVATTPKMYGGVVARLATTAGCRVFLPDYRLAPEFPYPAPLQDALRVYDALRADGSEPEDLIVAGDSGGGGLTAALLAELGTEQRPHPAGAILFSPEIDLTLSGRSITENAPHDILPDQIPVEPYLDGADAHSPLASPLYADLHGYPPLLVTSGAEEMFVDEIRRFVERAEAAGVEVTYFEAPDSFHVFEILDPISRSTRTAFDEVHRFVTERLLD